uniref:Piwi domain-containing protein n=1 Tax=Panagrellus redivivus TaxID=6233 RepID=A0A7E4UMI5_PANRE
MDKSTHLLEVIMSDFIPVLALSGPKVLTKTNLHPLVGNIPNPTPEIAAKILKQAAPPEKVKIAFVLFDTEPFDARRRCVEALQNEGYTNIESIDPRSVQLSSCIFSLPLNCAIGEPVFVNYVPNYVTPFNTYPLYVIQKCENGWKFIDTDQHPDTALSQYPSARNVVIYKDVSKAIKEEVSKLFPRLKLHFCDLPQLAAYEKYLLNRVNNGNFDGYEVLPFCKVLLTVEFTNKRQNLTLTDRVPPFTIEKEIDIADAPIVTIYGCCDTDDGLTVIKTFKLKTKAFRKALITVNVDKTLIPDVSMKTASTYKPRDRQTPVIYAVRRLPKMYTLTAIFEDHVVDEGVFSATADVFTHIVRSSAIPAVKGIFFIHDHENTIHQFQEFRDFCAAKVFPAVDFIPKDSTTLSFILGRAGFSVKPGQTITVVTPTDAFIVQRDGHFLQILDKCKPEDYDINEYYVDTVIIENNENTFTRTDLEHLRLKYYPRTVIVIPGAEFLKQPLPKFFWSRVNGTDYGGNLFCNFTNFEFLIEGDGFETVKTRFKAIPHTVTADIVVGDAKTLKVIKFHCACHIDAYQEFHVPFGAKAVRFTICVESVCDITITMDVIDETEVKRQPEKPKAIENLEHSNPKTSTVDLVIQFGIKSETISLTDRVTPFTVSKEVDVGDASEVTVRAISHGKIDSTPAVKTLKFKKPAYRKVLIIVDADQHFATDLTLRTASTYKPTDQVTEPGNNVEVGISQLKLDPPSTTVLTFTSDNLVLIEANKTFTGDKEIPAYVRLQSGRAPEVGQKAFDALKKHPGSIFYG